MIIQVKQQQIVEEVKGEDIPNREEHLNIDMAPVERAKTPEPEEEKVPKTYLTSPNYGDTAAFYSDKLLNDVIPFWLKNGLDREFGGIMTALDQDGTVIDTDKSVWF